MQLVDYKEEYKNQVIALLADGRGPDFLKTKSGIWAWQYHENPFDKDSSKGIVIIEGDAVLGFRGFMPVELEYEGRHVEAKWGCDAAVAQQHRGKGLGWKMIDAAITGSDIVISLGINSKQEGILRKHGFQVNTDIEQYYYVGKSRGIEDLAKMIMQRLLTVKSKAFNQLRKDRKLKADIPDVLSLSKDIDILWEKVKSGYTKIVKRDYIYIKWKYGSHPLKKYHCIAVHDDKETVGIGIFGKDEEMSRLVDYIGPSRDIRIKQLIVEMFMKQCAGSHLLECTCTDDEFKKLLGQSGFRRYSLRPRFYVYSNLKNDLNPEKNWFITGGDSDNDIH